MLEFFNCQQDPRKGNIVGQFSCVYKYVQYVHHIYIHTH